jgi:hypothetical protein
MPYLQEFGLVLDDNPFDLIEFAGGKAITGRQDNRLEPKLGLIASGFDMNMGRFLTLITEEIEGEPTDT